MEYQFLPAVNGGPAFRYLLDHVKNGNMPTRIFLPDRFQSSLLISLIFLWILCRKCLLWGYQKGLSLCAGVFRVTIKTYMHTQNN